jgi:predicted MFS family arabinose efflux permease
MTVSAPGVRERTATPARHRPRDAGAKSNGFPPTGVTLCVTRRLFGSLLGLVFLVNFGRTAFAPLLPELQTAFGVGPATVGVVASLVWLGTGAVRFPVGYLLTRVARHRVVVVSGVVLAAAAAFTAEADSVRTLQAGSLLIGLASGAYFATAVPLIGDLFPEGVGRAVGVHGMSAQAAAVVAPTVVVVVLATASWRAVFWLLAGGSLLVTGVLVVATRGGAVPADAGADRNFRAALGHWRVIGTGILMIATAGFVWQGLFNFYVSYLTTAKGVGTATASTLLTITFAAGVPAFWLGGRLADRLPHVPYIVGLLVAFTAGVLALTVVQGLAGLVAVSLLVGYVIHSLFPALDTYVLGALPADARGSTYAVFSGLSLLVEANGSGAVGVLTEAGYAFDTVFRAFAAGLAVVIVALVVLSAVGRLPGTTGGVRPGTESHEG